MIRSLLSSLLLILLHVSVSAQTVINPKFIDFTASPDHNATKLDGTFVLTRYEMVSMQMTSTGALVWTQDLGKPIPTTSNLITVVLPAILPITSETLYAATVSALGPDGISPPSAPSNPFGVAGTKVPGAVSNVKVR